MPLQLPAFFSLSTSILTANSISDSRRCESFPVSGSFLLLRSQGGSPAAVGFLSALSMADICPSPSCPSLRPVPILRWLSIAYARGSPIPAISSSAAATFLLPSRSLPASLTTDLVSDNR